MSKKKKKEKKKVWVQRAALWMAEAGETWVTGEVSDSAAAAEIYSAPSGQFIDEALMEYSSRDYHKH